MEQTQDWPKTVTLDVAREVRRYRKMRELSTDQLAARCAELGSPIHRSVLAKLESGHRENVTVIDLVTLGRALAVPPLVLLYPVGREDDSEAWPGQHVGPWDAAKLFTGEMAWPESDQGELLNVGLFREHDRMLQSWERARERAEHIVGDDNGIMANVEAALGHVRGRMRDRGLIPPSLPADLAARLSGAE